MINIELTTKQAQILETLLNNDIREMSFVLEHERLQPGEENDRQDIAADITADEEILRLLQRGRNYEAAGSELPDLCMGM